VSFPPLAPMSNISLGRPSSTVRLPLAIHFKLEVGEALRSA
jgi:hypothetical protein